MKKILIPLVVAVLGWAGSAQAAQFLSNKENLTVKEAGQGDIFASGSFASISAPVKGELFVVGNNVTVGEKPGRSIFAAGNNVTIEKGAAYNAFVAGSNLSLAGEYGNDVYAAGDTVMVKEGTVIKGDLRVAGTRLILNGKVEGSLYFGGSYVESGAEIGGGVNGEAEKLVFTGGSIKGDLKYAASTDATGLDKVKVGGSTERRESKRNEVPYQFPLLSSLYALLSTLVLGAAAIMLIPRMIDHTKDMLNLRWRELFWRGLLFVLLVPLAILLLLMTVVGWKLVAVLAGIYVVILTLGSLIGTFWLGQQIINQLKLRPGSRGGELFVGIIVVVLLGSLPGIRGLVGTLVFLGATVPAVGALLTHGREKLS